MSSRSSGLLSRRAALAALLAAFAAPVLAQSKPEQQFPDIIAAKVTPRGGEVFDFDVTVSSTYDTAARYADAFRITGTDGKVFGERILFHDHADEQPFTRDLYGVTLPAGIRTIVVQGRDKTHGYGGKTLTVAVPGR